LIKAIQIIESLNKLFVLNERNVINQEDIEVFMDSFRKYCHHPEMTTWLNTHLRNYLINDYPDVSPLEVARYKPGNLSGNDPLPSWAYKAIDRGDDLYVLRLFSPDEVRKSKFYQSVSATVKGFTEQVIDILAAMNATYPEREYYKLVKSPMSDNLVEQAMRILRLKQKRGGVEETGIDYPDGCKWVTLHTFETIHWEGEEMSNCLKKDTAHYAQNVADGKIILYSLRDAHDKPEAIMEVTSDKWVRQIKGWQNGKVKEKYQNHCIDFLNRGNFEHINDLKNIDAIDDHDKVHSVRFWNTCLDGDLEKVKEFIDSGSDVNSVHPADGRTPLICACQGKHAELVKYLVKEGADIYAEDKDGCDAMFYVSLMFRTDSFPLPPSLELMEYFLKLNVDPDKPYKFYDREGPLLIHFSYGPGLVALKRIELLLRYGAKKGIDEAVRRTIHYDNLPLMKLLVEYGADVNAMTSEFGEPILNYALISGRYDSAEFLIQKGADPNKKDVNGRTSIMVVFAGKKVIQMLKFLISKGADVNAESKQGITPLWCAIRSGNYEGIEILLQNGADPNGVYDKKSYIELAMDSANYEIAGLLKKYGAK
jgi:ankyrin repeat protein